MSTKQKAKFTIEVIDKRPVIYVSTEFTQQALIQFYSGGSDSERYHAGLQLDGKYDCSMEKLAESFKLLLQEASSSRKLDKEFYNSMLTLWHPFIRNHSEFDILDSVVNSKVNSWS